MYSIDFSIGARRRKNDDRLRDLLEIAIQGKGAFGRFKNIIKRDEAEESRWFNFSAERETNRAIEWLSSHGLTVDRS